jgi:PAS domain S-box-containing protein
MTPDSIHVLHVDSDPDLANASATHPEEGDQRLTVTTARSASEGLEALAEEPVECVVSGYDLPDENGIEFLDAVRESYPELPFILYTHEGNEEIASAAISAGVTDYVRGDGEDRRTDRLADAIEDAVAERRARNQPTETRRFLGELSEVTTDVLWMFTHDWSELRYINSAYEEVWGRSREALAADPLDFLDGIHPEDRDRVRDAMDRLSNGEAVDVEFRVNPEEGYERWVWVQGEPITDEHGSVVRVAGFVRDVTDRVEREQELERQNERLEEFASIVSHDLRNPLNVAEGRLELARGECESDHLDDVANALDRMERLIDDILTLAREGDRPTDLESVSLDRVVEQCWQTVATAEARLEVDAQQAIRVDPSRLKQLLENVIRNSVEHGGEDVTVTVGDLDDGFYVADDGPGIPDDDRDQIFETGYSTAEDGTGFGLSIVSEIADAHDWSITVTDSQAGGTRLEFSGVPTAE